MLIVETYERKQVGTISLTGKKLTSNNPALQSIIDAAVRRNNEDTAKAYDELSRFSNGYLTIREEKLGSELISDQLKSDDRNLAVSACTLLGRLIRTRV